VDVVLLSGTLVLSVAVAFLACRACLAGLFAVMNRSGLPFIFHWKRVVFASALFWFWYLTPVLASSDAATRIIRLIALR
jgi:hypothetical protein